MRTPTGAVLLGDVDLDAAEVVAVADEDDLAFDGDAGGFEVRWKSARVP